MFYLVYYSQTERGKETSANDVLDKHPADFLLNLIEDFPEVINKLLFAMEISEEQYKKLNGVL